LRALGNFRVVDGVRNPNVVIRPVPISSGAIACGVKLNPRFTGLPAEAPVPVSSIAGVAYGTDGYTEQGYGK
jgi:hypothetical protein